MILKLKTGAPGWHYVDRVQDFRTYGFIAPAIPKPGTDAVDPAQEIAKSFRNLQELADAADATWGGTRDFDQEIWPDLRDDGAYVEAGVARTDDVRMIFVMWADEGFLLSDDGKTIDRLR